jgi:hypothetical protein
MIEYGMNGLPQQRSDNLMYAWRDRDSITLNNSFLGSAVYR